MKLILLLVVIGLHVSGHPAIAQTQTETPQITQAAAEAAALKLVPAGAVKESKSESIDGKPCWVVVLTRKDSKNVTRVEVDGSTGKVIASETEGGGE